MRFYIFIAAIVLIGFLLYAGGWQGQAIAEPRPDSSKKIEIDVESYGTGNTADTRYHIPTGNGMVVVGEYASQHAIRASDDVAGFRTEMIGAGVRSSHFFINGTKHKSEYVDIDGDGLIDAMESDSKLYISVEGRWLEVSDQMVGFSVGNSRSTVAEPHTIYTFKGSAWVRE